MVVHSSAVGLSYRTAVYGTELALTSGECWALSNKLAVESLHIHAPFA